MVQHRRWLTILTHSVLILGVLVIAFPIYLAFVASTHTLDDLVQAPMPLVPGGELLANYGQMITSGLGEASGFGRINAGRMMLNSLVMALGIAVGKIAISIIAPYAFS